jgi:hypothetical protein
MTDHHRVLGAGTLAIEGRALRVRVVHGDITTVAADVAVFKYAGNIDPVHASLFGPLGIVDGDSRLPTLGNHLLMRSNDALRAPLVMLVGTVALAWFDYVHIRQLTCYALEALATRNQPITTITMTVHGVGIGLDEHEAFDAQLAGVLDAMRAGTFTPSLREIVICETNEKRALRLAEQLQREQRIEPTLVLPPMRDLPNPPRAAASHSDSPGWIGRIIDWADDVVSTSDAPPASGVSTPSAPAPGSEALLPPPAASPAAFSPDRTAPTFVFERAGVARARKPHLFVAMQFGAETDDLFHYGIKQAINATGYLCERVDELSYTGDILSHIRHRIDTATAVVAELTEANPNVYLEVGYAWGRQIPTILLVRDAGQLRFDVRGQRCLVHTSIRDLEGKLTRELQELLPTLPPAG